MKQFTSMQRQLLDWLADEQCHSGQTLGDRLGVSRTAVWKTIKQLTDLGVPVACLPHQGYQLTRRFIPLDETVIRQTLASNNLSQDCSFHLFSELDSTNRFLKDLEKEDLISVCAAEKQTQGRGRFGRTWSSPFGDNLYFSARWRLDCCVSKLSGLSLVVSLAILEVLQSTCASQDIRIKWPNDLIWQHQKTGGILIELVAESNACVELVIGMGINVNSRHIEGVLTDKPWTSLYEICGHYVDRNLLMAHILQSLDSHLQEFLAHDFSYFLPRWQKADYLKDNYISVVQSGKTIYGLATGVSNQGQLCLLDGEGKQWFLSSGDTSLQMGTGSPQT